MNFDFRPEVLDLATNECWLLDAGSYATGPRHAFTGS